MAIVLLIPLMLGVWTMAWRAWFRLPDSAWMPVAVGLLTLLYITSEFLSRSSSFAVCPIQLSAQPNSFPPVCDCCLCFLCCLSCARASGGRIAKDGLRCRRVLLVSVGLFGQELSELHIPGIWFPFGTGVSRTQFAYAAFYVVLSALLLRRLLFFARREGQPIDAALSVA